MSGGWSEDEIKKAQEMTANGESAGKIAEALGRSRNAVVGKWFRCPELFPKRRTKKVNRKYKTRAQREPKASQPATGRKPLLNFKHKRSDVELPPLEVTASPIVELDHEMEATILAYSVNLMDMRDDLCHWITQGGDGEPYLYCGSPQQEPGEGRLVEPGYCSVHGPRMRQWGKGRKK